MASSKRLTTNGIPSFFVPISKHGDSTPNHLKSQMGLVKRGRNDPNDGVVTSSFTSAPIQAKTIENHSPSVDSWLESQPLSITQSDNSDKKIKFEHTGFESSTAYLQMPSRDLEHRLLLQSPEHLPILSDKDYASSNYVPPTSVAECAALPPSIPCLPPTHVRCSSPLFDEDDRVLSEMKLKPAKGVAEEFSLDALILPKSFMDLEVIFDQVLKILATAHARGGVGKRGTPLEALKGDMERMYQRSFRKEHLQQITALVPDCLILSHACKDGKACHRTVCINTSKMNLCLDRQVIHWKYLAEMKSSLRQSMLSFLQTRHTEFLQKYHPELKLNPERNLSYKWHADFDLSAVHLPSIDLPPLPQVEVPVMHSVIKDVVVQITPEIELAFEKIQAETMTPEKLQYITDCSKSAIGKQNIEKIQKYELKQFALQQSFKLADERDAETKFQMAADALRCLFRHRNKPALPLADVLKVLQQTKGLTFKSSLDAMDMVNQVVEKLPAFFSRKKFPTYGEMVRFLSSELFPWHKPRV